MRHNPIFIRGLSRSGGTLLVTLLDAHPDIAMSYELYPTLLQFGGDEDAEVKRALADLKHRHRGTRKGAMPEGLRLFVARCARGGILPDAFVELVERHWADGFSFATDEGRFRFIGKCCEAKQIKEGKSRWGLKCNNQYEFYSRFWPDAGFIDIVRDGRDVIASQKVTGAFNKTIHAAATGWKHTHRQFMIFQAQAPASTYIMHYEKLVSDPAREVATLCRFIGVPYVASMLDYHRQDLTIYQSTHLSMDRISKPIDTSQIGRWRGILSAEELRTFDEVTGDLMAEFGYDGDYDAERRAGDRDHRASPPEERARSASLAGSFLQHIKRFFC